MLLRQGLALLLVPFLIISTTGCATIVHGGTKQKVRINSTPEGADIEIDGMERGQTPAEIKLKRSDTHTVILRKEGYKDKRINIDQEFSGWVLGNIILGGIIGILIDMLAGGGWNLDPEDISVKLTPLVAGEKKEEGAKDPSPLPVPSIPPAQSEQSAPANPSPAS